MQVIAPMRRNLASAVLLAFVLAGAMTMLGACNTTAGLGQDVSATGKAVTTGAEKVKQGLLTFRSDAASYTGEHDCHAVAKTAWL